LAVLELGVLLGPLLALALPPGLPASDGRVALRPVLGLGEVAQVPLVRPRLQLLDGERAHVLELRAVELERLDEDGDAYVDPRLAELERGDEPPRAVLVHLEDLRELVVALEHREL